MAKQLTCPFCGKRGLISREHVWTQGLHATPGAKALLLDAHRERIERVTLAGEDPANLRAEYGTPDWPT